MTDLPRADDHADDERLSAYLTGDLPAEQMAALEADLATDPRLVRRLDLLAEALVALGGVDDAIPPAGYDERLADRLAGERKSRAVGDLGAHRAARVRSGGWWTGVGAAAAVVTLAAVVGASVLSGVGGGGSDEAGVEAGGSATQAGGAEPAEGGGDASAPEPGPVVVEQPARVRDEQELSRRYADLSEVQQLLGVPVEEAADTADRYTAQLESGARALSEPEGAAEGDSAAEAGTETAVAPGGAVAACLGTIRSDADAPLIPARVEVLRYAGSPAIAYVLVTASPGASTLDRTEIWVMAADDCRTLVFQQS